MLNNLIRFIFPERCHICRGETKLGIYPLCKSCRTKILQCKISRSSIEKDYYLGAAVSFDKITQDLIHKLKYGRKEILSIIMGKMVYNQVLKNLQYDIDIVVPVPMSDKRKKFRGFNQTDLLAKEVAKLLTCSYNLSNLIRAVHTVTQTKLNRKQRERNMRDVFEVLNPMIFKNKNILIIDDVITTGSTTNSCRDTLLKYGAKNVYTISFARA